MKLVKLITLVFVIISIPSLFLFYRSKEQKTQEVTKKVNEKEHPEYEEPASEDIKTVVVEIKNRSFVPKVLKIKKDTIVAFVNRDAELHTVTSDTAGTDKQGSFDLGEMKTGEQRGAAKYELAGEYTYHCKIHPEMKGKIIVE